MLLQLSLFLLSIAAVNGAKERYQYQENVVCNNSSRTAAFKCICYRADPELPTGPYQDCKLFIDDEMDVVAIEIHDLELTDNAQTLEKQFRQIIAKIITAGCKREADHCPGTMLDVTSDRVIVLQIKCKASGTTQINFTILQSNKLFSLTRKTTMDAYTIIPFLYSNRREMKEALGGIDIGGKFRVETISPPDLDPPKPTGKRNIGLMVVLFCVAVFFIVVYSIAIFKVCKDHHQRKRHRKLASKQGKPTQLLAEPNDHPPTKYGALDITVAAAEKDEIVNYEEVHNSLSPASSVQNSSPATIVQNANKPNSYTVHVDGVSNERESKGTKEDTGELTTAHFDRFLQEDGNELELSSYGSVQHIVNHSFAESVLSANGKSASIHDFPEKRQTDKAEDDDLSSCTSSEGSAQSTSNINADFPTYPTEINDNDVVVPQNGMPTPRIVIDNQEFLSNLGGYNLLTNAEDNETTMIGNERQKKLVNGDGVNKGRRHHKDAVKVHEKDAYSSGGSSGRKQSSSSNEWSTSPRGSDSGEEEEKTVGEYSQLAESALSLDTYSQ